MCTWVPPTLRASVKTKTSSMLRSPMGMHPMVMYRWEPLAFWDLDMFVDAGAVGGLAESLSFENLEVDWGFGTRLKTYLDIVVRFEIAFSNETTRYYVRGSTSF